MPTAEAEITTEMVEALVRPQHSDLAGPLRPVANGWDNVVYRLGDDLSVRLPRRQVAVEPLRKSSAGCRCSRSWYGSACRSRSAWARPTTSAPGEPDR